MSPTSTSLAVVVVVAAVAAAAVGSGPRRSATGSARYETRGVAHWVNCKDERRERSYLARIVNDRQCQWLFVPN